MIKIKRGLDIPIAGAPEQRMHPAAAITSVAVVGSDYVDLKPTMNVKVGDKVLRGQSLFSDKKNSSVQFVAPAGGEITAVNRGEKRVLESVVIRIDHDLDQQQAESFPEIPREKLTSLTVSEIINTLVASGLWTAFRTRPFNKIPNPESEPNSIFVTAMDTNPLAADPAIIISAEQSAFDDGMKVLSGLNKPIYLCKSPSLPLTDKYSEVTKVVDFAGPHPAGLAGTHIHFLDPVSLHKTVWSIGYQDVIALGKLFTTGKLSVDRVIALAGPRVAKPRLLKTRLGASISEIAKNELSVETATVRLISGSVLSGRTAAGTVDYLGRYHQQIVALNEGYERKFLAYLAPGFNKHSAMNVFFSKFTEKRKKFFMTTTTNGSPRAMVPVGAYEKVMPLDILATQLLRYLIVGDTDMAQKLGCLELDEEDLALCTYVCPGKYEYGPILRDNLTRIEKEG